MPISGCAKLSIHDAAAGTDGPVQTDVPCLVVRHRAHGYADCVAWLSGLSRCAQCRSSVVRSRKRPERRPSPTSSIGLAAPVPGPTSLAARDRLVADDLLRL